MTLQFRDLPYAMDALEPYYPQRIVSLHYEKHHRGYFDKTKTLIRGTKLEDADLETIIRETAGKAESKELFNNAAQIWNHDVFWMSMRPGGGGKPERAVAAAIADQFGGYDEFRKRFKECAVTQFGSGWAWLTVDDGKLALVQTGNAETPMTKGTTVLLTIDVWEHAYYLKYENRRPEFIDVFLDHLVNWQHVEQAFAALDAKPQDGQKRKTA